MPAVLYGPKIKETLLLEVDSKEFEKVYKETGESTLISLEVQGKKEKNLVLIHAVERDSLTEKPIHIDFYQPSLEEKIAAKVPIVFEGEAPAVKELGGTLVKNISEIEVKALPQNLPREIRVNIGSLKTFTDHILIKNLEVQEGVEIQRNPEEIVASVSLPERIEEELKKPIEEKAEEVEKVDEKKPAVETAEIEKEKEGKSKDKNPKAK